MTSATPRSHRRLVPGGPDQGRTLVVVVLTIGLATAINLITLGVVYDAIFSRGPGLSENATQILSTAFGGMIGVVGSFVGFRAGVDQGRTERTTTETKTGTVLDG